MNCVRFFRFVAPTKALQPWVSGYWFLTDVDGAYTNRPIRTSPFCGAILNFSLSGQREVVGGPELSDVTFSGIQNHSLCWKMHAKFRDVLIIFALPGLVRLFPGMHATKDNLVDGYTMFDSRKIRALVADLTAARTPQASSALLDQWLHNRLKQLSPPAEYQQLVAAHAMLRDGTTVRHAAAQVKVSERQLARWFKIHTGVGPKRIMDLERLVRSIRAHRGQGDPGASYSDQSHQIRTYKRFIGVSPTVYKRGLKDLPRDYLDSQASRTTPLLLAVG